MEKMSAVKFSQKKNNINLESFLKYPGHLN